ncbi:MAG: hypothetical protein ACLT3D_07135 [Lawsonibacter sp.]
MEICEDLWASAPPPWPWPRSGATVILNLSASNETGGQGGATAALWCAGQSGRLVCGYVYADAGEGESTTDLVFSGHNIIAENGALLAERRFAAGLTCQRGGRGSGWPTSAAACTTFPRPGRQADACTGPSLLPGAGGDHAHPPRLPQPLRPRRRRSDRASAATRSCISPALGLKKRHGAHRGRRRRWWACPAGWTPPWPSSSPPWPWSLLDRPGQRHHRRHHALLRHHRRTRDNAVELAERLGATLQAHRHRRGGEGPLPGHRTVHGGPRRDL